MKCVYVVLLAMTFFIGCAPKEIKPFVPPEIKFEKTPEYSYPEIAEKPVLPKGMWLDDKFRPTTNPDKLKYIAYTHEEFKNVGAINSLAKDQKTIIEKQGFVIEKQTNNINDLKELSAYEHARMKEYLQLWADAENAYRQEKYERERDDMINKVGMYIIMIGSIVLVSLN